MEVQILSSQLIRPSTPLPPSRYELTGLDRIMQYVPYQKRIIFYAAPEAGMQNVDVAELLKATLSQVLVAFYPLAGRLRSGDGVSEPALELDCTQQLSVQFSEAATDSTLDELGEFKPCGFCDSLCEMQCSPQHPWTLDTPLFFVQLTRFKCGGFSIGFASSHQIMDGVSAWFFMSSWAELARTGNMDRNIPDVTYGYERLNQEMVSFKDMKNDVHDAYDASKLRTKVYKMDRCTINKLKTAAGSVNFSSFEIVCGYFWRIMVLAKGLSDSSSCRFMVLVDCRGRVQSLPSRNYFGNAIWSTIATAKVGQLTRQDGVFSAANLLHEAIASFDKDTAEAKFHERRRRPKQARSASSSELPAETPYTLVAVESPHQPVYDCDFGFGRPIGVTFGRNDLHDGKLYLFPLANGAGVSVTVVLEAEAMDRLTSLEQTKGHLF